MKQKIIELYRFIKEALFDDVADRYLFLVTLILYTLALLLWYNLVKNPDVYIYTKIKVYPNTLLSTVLGINTLMAISSHNKEKEISNLLLMTNVITTLLIIALETFYYISLKAN